MTTLTAVVGGGNWGTAATWSPAQVPTAADDCVLAVTSGNVTIDGTSGSPSLCRSLDCTGYLGTLTHAASKYLAVGDGTTGNFTLAGTMTYSPAVNAQINFVSTTTGNTITVAGKNLPVLLFNGSGGAWTLQDSLNTVSSNITLSQGTLDTNGQSVTTTGTFTISGSSARTLTLGASVISCNSWNASTVTNLTFNSDTSTITLTGTNFTGGGLAYHNLTCNTAGTMSVSGVNSFNDFSRAGTAAKTNITSFISSQTISNQMTITGNSTTNRMLIRSSSAGTQITLTVANVNVSNVDLIDINGAGAGSWDLSAITGNSGDGGGNSNITFTTGITCYMKTGATANWSSSNWFTTSGGSTPARVPLPQDDAIFDANSITAGSVTITGDMPRLCKSMNWTGVTNSPTFNRTTANSVYGSITYVAGMTISGNQSMVLGGRGSYTITTAGQTIIGAHTVDCDGGGTYILQDDFYCPNQSFSLNTGALDMNNNDITCTVFTCNSGLTRSLTMGTGTITVNSTGTVITFSTSNGLTLSAENGTLAVTNTSASTKTVSLNGSNLTFGTLTISGASGNGTVTIQPSASAAPNGTKITTLNLSNYCAIRITGLRTLYLTNPPAWVASSGQNIVIGSTLANAASISCASGTAICDYLTLDSSTATGGATFYAGSHSTDSGNNTGWSFTDPPAPGGGAFMVITNSIV